jgi:hypothetical protein
LVIGLALLALTFQPVFAAPFSSDGIILEIPAGFEGPVTQNGVGGKVFGFTKQSLAPDIRALLQVTIVDPDNSAIPTSLTEEQLSQGAERYALDFVKGIERRRTEFKKGNVVRLVLGGIPAAKVSWRGNSQGIATNGVVYCVIVKGRVVLFHTQDAGVATTSNMLEAIKAIDAVKIK